MGPASLSSFFFRNALILEEDEGWEKEDCDDKGRKYWTQTDFLYHLEQNPAEERRSRDYIEDRIERV